MKKLIPVILVSLLVAVTSLQAQKSFYDFKATSIDGKPVNLADYRGKKLLVVNVASKCGYTPQYSDLEALYEKYKGRNFTIIAFPANNFMGQEPGTNEEIREFCTSKYNVTFPMMSKISVKGKDIDPLYKWLTSKEENGVMDAPVKWNFQKFMISEDGTLVGMIAPGDKPFDQRIVDWIEAR